MTTRRQWLQGGTTGAVGLLGLSSALNALAATKRQRWSSASLALRPMQDPTTGFELLELPEGFSYFSFSWAGQQLRDGGKIPRAHDGMGVLAQQGSNITLMRNHEVVAARGAFSTQGPNYDPKAGGGVCQIELDLDKRTSVTSAVLTGTIQNCAGGITPWGTWLSCEEFVQIGGEGSQTNRAFVSRPGELPGLSKDHGFVFEVKPNAEGEPKRLDGLGVFRHEAAAVHAASGAVFLTEDQHPRAGFYRFMPKVKGQLDGEGEFAMMRLKNLPDARRAPLGQWFEVDWVRIKDPLRGHTPKTRDGIGVLNQGLKAGGTAFVRLEGLCVAGDRVFFTASSGGSAGLGQVFEYDLLRNAVKCLIESTDKHFMEMPDNIIVSPRGSLVLCEDGYRAHQMLLGFHPAGGVVPIARNIIELNRPGFPRGTFHDAEWAGCCFSPEGKWLFANIYAPGISVAITGPWEQLGL